MLAQNKLYKWVSNYPNYSISTSGEVRRKAWLVKRGANMYVRGGFYLKQYPDINKYIKVHLYEFDGAKTKKVYMVHRLVAEAFIPNPNNKPHVNHKNGIKWDNRVENLEWCTRVENQQHAVKNGLYKNPKGQENKMSKLKEVDILKIRNLYSKGDITQNKLSEMFNVAQSVINRIIKKLSWKHV